MNTDPPFQVVREHLERQDLLKRDLKQNSAWVLCGSLCGWGDFAIPLFDLAVFLWLPVEIRMQRLRQREPARYGEGPDHQRDPRYAQHMEFLDWAAACDTGGADMHSRSCHENWMATPPCPLLRIEEDLPVEQKVERGISRLNAEPRGI